jgi:hypothetical protein
MSARVCVLHLVRAANGPAPLEAFLDAYRRHPAGVQHRLLLVLKGFASDAEAARYRALAADVAHDAVRVSDEGFDLDAYVRAAADVGEEYCCFLNSFSRPLDAGWLATLSAHATRPDVGLVGATGSWESALTNDHVAGRVSELALGAVRGLVRHGRPSGARALASRRVWALRRHFAPFPNPHVRTNAFVVRRALWEQVGPQRLRTKAEAERFESGLRGLTRRVSTAGLRTIVVGRDGAAYEPAEWPNSRTFRVDEQENLLVADNRTDEYASADAATRAALRRMAWGDAA